MTVGTQVTMGPVRPKKRRNVWHGLFVPMLRDPKSATGLILFTIFVLIAILAPMLAPFNPQATNFQPSLAPTHTNLLGTTSSGQDVLSQFIYGTRTTLIVGIGAGLLSTIIALLVGITAGYRRGWVDSILNTLSNVFLVMPGLALLIVITSLVKNSSPLMNGLIIAFTGWAWGARVFRAQTMSLAHRDFVVAARLSGASSLRIMVTEIAPNMMSIVASNVMYASLGAILAESGLAFLGLENVQQISWGTMLYWASQGSATLTGAWWWFVPPGLGIALVGLSLVLMNFAIDQITNPRLRVQRRRKTNGKSSRA